MARAIDHRILRKFSKSATRCRNFEKQILLWHRQASRVTSFWTRAELRPFSACLRSPRWTTLKNFLAPAKTQNKSWKINLTWVATFAHAPVWKASGGIHHSSVVSGNFPKSVLIAALLPYPAFPEIALARAHWNELLFDVKIPDLPQMALLLRMVRSCLRVLLKQGRLHTAESKHEGTWRKRPAKKSRNPGLIL